MWPSLVRFTLTNYQIGVVTSRKIWIFSSFHKHISICMIGGIDLIYLFNIFHPLSIFFDSTYWLTHGEYNPLYAITQRDPRTARFSIQFSVKLTKETQPKTLGNNLHWSLGYEKKSWINCFRNWSTNISWHESKEVMMERLSIETAIL